MSAVRSEQVCTGIVNKFNEINYCNEKRLVRYFLFDHRYLFLFVPEININNFGRHFKHTVDVWYGIQYRYNA